MLQLGYKAGPEQFPPTELLDFAVAAEQAGFDHLFFHSAYPDQKAFLQAYGRDVLPQLRSRNNR
jgi:alkanesulfonate monooxygenase SsuD/methylene tetrahydromethanopterin reductase-like flavin-dependent oxidoreductase (luciferase family)